MDDLKDKNINLTAQKLTDEIQNMSLYNNFFSDIQKMVSSTEVKKFQFKETLLETMKKAGMETELRNTVFHWVRSYNLETINGYSIKEPLGYLRKAQMQWEKRIQKSLNSMTNEIGVPLARYRLASDRDDILDKWTELSTYDVDLSQYRPVYAPKDFLEVLLWIRSPNYQHNDVTGAWDFTQIPLKVKTFAELVSIKEDIPTFSHIFITVNEFDVNINKTDILYCYNSKPDAVWHELEDMYNGTYQWPRKARTNFEDIVCDLERNVYVDLARGDPLIGVNAHMPSSSNYPTLEAERTSLGDKVIASNHAPMAQEFLKRGCPRCLRGKLWAQVLGSDVKQMHIDYFKELKERVLYFDLMVDKLIFKDVQLTASNDDTYFVFEDVLYQVMLCFTRDTEILSVFNHSAANPVHAVLKNKPVSVENTVVFPPSGVIPFHGFTMYATPFCYLYDDPVALYFTFRAFYMRYWFRLHEVSSHEQGILCLCLLFEKLLQRHEPLLWCHFKQIKIPAVRVVFKWLMRSFSGHLPPEQLLFLWDLILAYDSLEILPLLAVAIISFRKDNLLQVDSLQSVEAVLADLSSIAVMPLLQMTLMRD